MPDWKILIAGAIIAIMVISAVIFGGGNINLTGFSFFGTSVPTKNISISASLDAQDVIFETDAENVIIQLEAQDNEFLLGNQRVALDADIVVEIEKYDGKFEFSGDMISLSGIGKSVTLNGIKISQKEGDIPIFIENIEFFSIEFSGALLPPMVFEQANGDAYIKGDKYYVKITDENLELSTFKGRFRLEDDQIILDGVTDRVAVPGDTALLIDE